MCREQGGGEDSERRRRYTNQGIKLTIVKNQQFLKFFFTVIVQICILYF
jgi:hypothetical protein